MYKMATDAVDLLISLVNEQGNEIKRILQAQTKTQSAVEETRASLTEIKLEQASIKKTIVGYDAVFNKGKGVYIASLAFAGIIGSAVITAIKWLFVAH